ncbi:MAG: TonB family protein [Elusimicrobia bacterium]|nr:TonB family protein [Elusimicrobiota bacterium]
MILKPNNLAIVPCIILSIILHGAVFIIISQRNKQENFIQIPFEVSFYAPNVKSVTGQPPAVPQVKQKNNKFLPIESAVEKQKVVEQKSVSPKTTSDIITKKKEEKKKEVKEKKTEQVTETVTEKTESKTKSVSEQSTEPDTKAKTADTEKKESVSKAEDGAEYSKGIMLENKNFRYSYYTGAILKKIRRYWQDSNINVLRTVVYFRIEKDGTVSKLKVHKSSKNSIFDKNALRAVELASPFPPLPDGYEENSLGVYFEFKTT